MRWYEGDFFFAGLYGVDFDIQNPRKMSRVHMIHTHFYVVFLNDLSFFWSIFSQFPSEHHSCPPSSSLVSMDDGPNGDRACKWSAHQKKERESIIIMWYSPRQKKWRYGLFSPSLQPSLPYFKEKKMRRETHEKGQNLLKGGEGWGIIGGVGGMRDSGLSTANRKVR